MEIRFLVWTLTNDITYHTLLDTFIKGRQPTTPGLIYTASQSCICFDFVKELSTPQKVTAYFSVVTYSICDMEDFEIRRNLRLLVTDADAQIIFVHNKETIPFSVVRTSPFSLTSASEPSSLILSHTPDFCGIYAVPQYSIPAHLFFLCGRADLPSPNDLPATLH
jgi:hypothetical protein